MQNNEYANPNLVKSWNSIDWSIWWDENQPILKYKLSREELSELKDKISGR